jgi:hypothetical protein
VLGPERKNTLIFFLPGGAGTLRSAPVALPHSQDSLVNDQFKTAEAQVQKRKWILVRSLLR